MVQQSSCRTDTSCRWYNVDGTVRMVQWRWYSEDDTVKRHGGSRVPAKSSTALYIFVCSTHVFILGRICYDLTPNLVRLFAPCRRSCVDCIIVMTSLSVCLLRRSTSKTMLLWTNIGSVHCLSHQNHRSFPYNSISLSYVMVLTCLNVVFPCGGSRDG